MKKLIQLVFLYFAITSVVSDSTKTIMEFWNEQDAAFQLDNPEKVVLLLGDTGTGKTTLGLLLTNATLEATKDSTGRSMSQIRDKNGKIGTVTGDSHTIIPELFIDRESNISFYDCPGFKDSRSAEHDITIGYLVNKLLTHAKSFKIVLIVNHSSLKKSETQSIFPNFIKTIIKLFKNIDDYKDGIAMVTTKVTKTLKKVNRKFQAVNDSSVVIQVVDYLEELKNTTIEQMSPNMPAEERQINEQKLNLLNVLLENNGKTENGYDRIGVFRSASKAGFLYDDKLIQKEKRNILKMITKNIKFIGQNKYNKYGLVVSTDSQIYVNDLIDRIVHTELFNDVSRIIDKTKHYYKNKFETTQDFMLLNRTFHESRNVLNGLTCNETLTFTKKLLEKVSSMIDYSLRNNIHKHIEYIEFLLKIKTKNLPTPDTFTGLIVNATQYMKSQYNTYVKKSGQSLLQVTMLPMVTAISTEIKEFYFNVEQSTTDVYLLRDKLSKAHKDLLKVDIAKLQSLIDAINNLKIQIKAENLNRLNDLVRNMEDMPELVKKNFDLIETSTIVFRVALEEMEKIVSWYDYMIILDKNLPSPTIQTTPSHTEVIRTIIDACDTVKHVEQLDLNKLSPFVPNNANTLSNLKNMPLKSEKKKKLKTLLSLFVQKPTITCFEGNVMTVTGTVIRLSEVTADKKCFSNARSIEIFATISVIIESSFEKTGSNINIAIMSPIWTIIDSQTILLRGSDAKPKMDAKDCYRDCSTPPDGEAGNPGETGGNFLGIGAVFVNGGNLNVSSVGGNGGTGSNGGKGCNGVNGSMPIFPHELYNVIKICIVLHPAHLICIRKYLNHKGYEYEEDKDGFDITLWKKGMSGTSGGRGGHGGVGGPGGKAGLVKMIELDKKSHFINEFYDGNTGSCGKGGEGGKAAVKYFVRKCNVFWTYRFVWGGLIRKNVVVIEGMTDAGPRGLDCGSAKNRSNQESAHNFNHALETIKKFTDLLNRSANGDIRESQTRKFVDDILEKNVNVQQLLGQR